jgi:hypothetical protein
LQVNWGNRPAKRKWRAIHNSQVEQSASHALALYCAYCNFVRIQKSLKVSPPGDGRRVKRAVWGRTLGLVNHAKSQTEPIPPRDVCCTGMVMTFGLWYNNCQSPDVAPEIVYRPGEIFNCS